MIAQILFSPPAVVRAGKAAGHLVVRRPTLIVNDSGIEDTFGAFYGTVGLIRWENIVALSTRRGRSTGHERSASGTYLWILTDSPDDIRARRRRMHRAVARVWPVARLLQGYVRVPQQVLAMPVEHVVNDIYDHFQQRVQDHDVLVKAGDVILSSPAEDEDAMEEAAAQSAAR